MDIFNKIKAGRGPLGAYYEHAHGYYMFPKLEGDISSHMTFMGKKRLV